ncbi:unnamed protein product [Vicia faba]|uniref:SKP1-like protein n=1 Tax=Vicia faba TaxID=3906 RepID=A0AAV0ZUN2_VICFA|nr:unnamed protein product [Vicia faba]
MASTSRKKINLKSCDGEILEIDEEVALESQTMKQMIENDCTDDTGNPLPIPNVTSKILEKVIEYCKKHVDTANSDERVRTWDAEFVKVDQDTLFDLILAANYLKIQGLLDLTCKAMSDMIKGKNLEEIRKIFRIKNNFTKEEEDEIRRENQWAFE